VSRLKLTYVEWQDSCCSPGWDSPHGDEPLTIRSFGILVRKGKQSVTLSTSRSMNGRYMDQLTIPRSAIREMKRLKHKRE
jgi:hypothetical protein